MIIFDTFAFGMQKYRIFELAHQLLINYITKY